MKYQLAIVQTHYTVPSKLNKRKIASQKRRKKEPLLQCLPAFPMRHIFCQSHEMLFETITACLHLLLLRSLVLFFLFFFLVYLGEYQARLRGSVPREERLPESYM